MKKFKKITIIEPTNMSVKSLEILNNKCDKLVVYNDIPNSCDEIIKRIDDSDAILVSFTTIISKDILIKCQNLKYIGMCCSLYDESACSVDIRYCKNNGITVTGIKDYGDEGVREYVIDVLISLLHGYNGFVPFYGEISELTNVKVGILGMGVTGKLVSRALKYLGADAYYYSRTRKDDIEAEDIKYLELNELLSSTEFICSCLSKNVCLLYEEQFNLLKNHKVLINTSLSPFFEDVAFKKWISNSSNYYFADSYLALGSKEYLNFDNVYTKGRCSGMSIQAVERLNNKVLNNLDDYLNMCE